MKSSAKMTVQNGIIVSGTLNVLSGYFSIISNPSMFRFHTGNFNISTEDPMIFEGSHRYTGKVVGPVHLTNGTYLIDSINFSDKFSVSGSPSVNCSVTLNSHFHSYYDSIILSSYAQLYIETNVTIKRLLVLVSFLYLN